MEVGFYNASIREVAADEEDMLVNKRWKAEVVRINTLLTTLGSQVTLREA